MCAEEGSGVARVIRWRDGRLRLSRCRHAGGNGEDQRWGLALSVRLLLLGANAVSLLLLANLIVVLLLAPTIEQ